MAADFREPVLLGRSGLSVGRLGVAGGYGAPAEAFELAFDHGCNYFYHGSPRRPGMTRAIRNIAARGERDRLVVVAQVYSRWAWHLIRSVETFLAKTGLDYADILLLGWYNAHPPMKIIEACARLRDRGLINHLAVSSHKRTVFPKLAATGIFDAIHVRYNAAHRGAETEVFPLLPTPKRPGVVIYTATAWGRLLRQRTLPPGMPVPRASDCYRFVLSHPVVDVCITAPKNRAHMEENLRVLKGGPLSAEELDWMRRVGDRVHR